MAELPDRASPDCSTRCSSYHAQMMGTILRVALAAVGGTGTCGYRRGAGVGSVSVPGSKMGLGV